MYPDTRICAQLKSCTVIDFWLRDNLYRDAATVPFCNICYILTGLFHLSTLYRDTPGFDQNLYLDAKNRAKPSLHRDSLLAPLARGTGILPGAVVGLRLLNPTAGPLYANFVTQSQFRTS